MRRSTFRNKTKVLVAMSGGVDSSVAAASLVHQGYQVTGAFIKNWSDSKDPQTGECQWRRERRDAVRVAAALGIPLLTFDFEKRYRRLVVDEMLRGYQEGRTPNPDVLCNEYVKFGLFWDKAKELGFGLMATGHYAVVRSELSSRASVEGSGSSQILRFAQNDKGFAKLYRGSDSDKDQSYFLYRVRQEALAHTLFPIGHLKKSQVRQLASRYKLPVADKPDSQGICFIGKVDFQDFLASRIEPRPGDIVDEQGRVIGRHQGLHNYTVGQRHQIKVADKHAWYVADKDLARNRLVVVSRADHPWLKAKRLILSDLHWIADHPPKTPCILQVQARYRQKPSKGRLKTEGKDWVVDLATNLQAAAIGQSAVIYRGLECIGGGLIVQVGHA